MRVYLCRHAEAANGEPDETRELTARGHEQARELALLLATESPAPVVIVTSPLARARQTAAYLGEQLDAPLLVDTRLAPGATLASLEELVEELDGPVATVGHQPDCSEIVLALTGHDPGFPVGGMRVVSLGVPE
jgi:phosphohistidine phosphatase